MASRAGGCSYSAITSAPPSPGRTWSVSARSGSPAPTTSWRIRTTRPSPSPDTLRSTRSRRRLAARGTGSSGSGARRASSSSAQAAACHRSWSTGDGDMRQLVRRWIPARRTSAGSRVSSWRANSSTNHAPSAHARCGPSSPESRAAWLLASTKRSMRSSHPMAMVDNRPLRIVARLEPIVTHRGNNSRARPPRRSGADALAQDGSTVAREVGGRHRASGGGHHDRLGRALHHRALARREVDVGGSHGETGQVLLRVQESVPLAAYELERPSQPLLGDVPGAAGGLADVLVVDKVVEEPRLRRDHLGDPLAGVLGHHDRLPEGADLVRCRSFEALAGLDE